MKHNVGGADKVVRIVIGLAIIVVGVVAKSWWGLIGLVPLGTGLVGWCGLYPLLKISTCKTKAPTQP
jgi:hypothetical protein